MARAQAGDPPDDTTPTLVQQPGQQHSAIARRSLGAANTAFDALRQRAANGVGRYRSSVDFCE